MPSLQHPPLFAPRQGGPDQYLRAAALRIAVVGLGSSIVLSIPLWRLARTFPATPIVDVVPSPPPPWDLLPLLIFAAGLALLFSRPRRLVGLVVTVSAAAVLVLHDVMRLQPWFYQYVFLCIALAGTPRRSPGGIAAARFLMAVTYVWSGLHKFNLSFLDATFPWLMQPVLDALPPGWRPLFVGIGWTVPLVETLSGLGLFFARTRRPAVVCLVAMHAFILIVLGPAGHSYNQVVWPWNVASAVLMILLFWNAVVGPSRLLRPRTSWRHGLILLFFGALPALGTVGAWPAYLSASLYAGDHVLGAVHMSDATREKLPDGIARFADADDPYFLSIDAWALQELRVPAFPEEFVYRSVGAHLCTLADQSPDLVLEVLLRPNRVSRIRESRSFLCEDLSPTD